MLLKTSFLLPNLFCNVEFECCSVKEVFCKKVVHRNFAKFTGKHLSQSLLFNKKSLRPATLLKKETLVQVFSCEFFKIS